MEVETPFLMKCCIVRIKERWGSDLSLLVEMMIIVHLNSPASGTKIEFASGAKV